MGFSSQALSGRDRGGNAESRYRAVALRWTVRGERPGVVGAGDAASVAHVVPWVL